MPSYNSSISGTSRRRFLQTAAGLSLGWLCIATSLYGQDQSDQPLFTMMGVNASFKDAKAANEAGAEFLLMGVNNFLKPDEPESAFEKQLELLEKSPIPVLSCNSFLRGDELRSVGPNAMPENVLRFAETTFRRAKRAGVKFIVLGSSGSRSIPEGWTKEQADEQFISLLKKMGPLAAEQGVIVAVESLRAKECNYLTRISEAGEIITAVDHPNIRLLADLYHSVKMGDTPADFGKYAHLVALVEIAEEKGRAAPGVGGQDFRPYFKALKANGYSGPIEIEGSWKVKQLPRAFATIREQSP